MKSSFNPVLKERVFCAQMGSADAMTLEGVIAKSFVASILLFVGAFWSWNKQYGQLLSWQIFLFSGISLALYLLTVFRTDIAKVTVPLYALVQGLLLGSVSRLTEMEFPGVVMQAILGTFGVLGAMLIAYRTGIIRPSKKFMMVIFAAMSGIAITYFADFIAIMLGSTGFSFIHGNSNISIIFSLVVCVVVALRLILDFEFIVQQSKTGAPRKMEWLAVMGLMMTLILVYLEILSLLMKLYSRDKRD